MKLKKLHISGFGKLINFDYNFDDKLSVIVEENGWGKTTFANFIKAMFYSLPTTKTRSLDSNPRKKYKPWDSIVFGGNIVFEHNDKTYRIERTFGNQENEDTFYLFDEHTNKPSNDFSSNIGFELFGINAESFSKTTYIPQQDLKTELTDGISAKLNNLVEDKSDLISFNNAKEIIDNARKIYIKTGERGVLYEKQRELETIEKEQERLANLMHTISILKSKIQDNETKIQSLEVKEKELSDQINASSIREKVQLEIKTRENLQKQVDLLENQLKEVNQVLKNSPPTLNELEQTKTILTQNTELEKTISTLQSEIDAQNNEINKLLNFFNNSIPNAEDIDEINQTYASYQQATSQTQGISVSTYKKTPKALTISLILLNILLISTLSALFGFSIISLPTLIIPCVLTTCTSLVAFFIIKHKQINKNNQKITQNNLETIKNILQNQLAFNYPEGMELGTKIYVLNQNYTTLLEYQTTHQRKQQELDLLNRDYAIKHNNINNFLHFYYENAQKSEFAECLYNLVNLTDSFHRINNELKRTKDALLAIPEANKDTLFNNSELTTDELINEKNNITNTLSNLRREQLQNKTNLSTHLINAQELEDLEDRKVALSTDIEDINHKIKILKATEQLLDSAKDELDSMFLEPITKTFEEITQKLKAKDLFSFKIDTDLNISIEHNGQTKELSFMSRGYQDIAYIAARISCVKAMFKETKPFIILDDPFVNLDEEKVNLAKSVLNTLSDNYQIIYLVCHKSRI